MNEFKGFSGIVVKQQSEKVFPKKPPDNENKPISREKVVPPPSTTGGEQTVPNNKDEEAETLEQKTKTNVAKLPPGAPFLLLGLLGKNGGKEEEGGSGDVQAPTEQKKEGEITIGDDQAQKNVQGKDEGRTQQQQISEKKGEKAQEGGSGDDQAQKNVQGKDEGQTTQPPQQKKEEESTIGDDQAQKNVQGKDEGRTQQQISEKKGGKEQEGGSGGDQVPTETYQGKGKGQTPQLPPVENNLGDKNAGQAKGPGEEKDENLAVAIEKLQTLEHMFDSGKAEKEVTIEKIDETYDFVMKIKDPSERIDKLHLLARHALKFGREYGWNELNTTGKELLKEACDLAKSVNDQKRLKEIEQTASEFKEEKKEQVPENKVEEQKKEKSDSELLEEVKKLIGEGKLEEAEKIANEMKKESEEYREALNLLKLEEVKKLIGEGKLEEAEKIANEMKKRKLKEYREARDLLNEALWKKVENCKDPLEAENYAKHIEKGTKKYDEAMEKVADLYLLEAKGGKDEYKFKKAREFARKIGDPLHRAKELLDIAKDQCSLKPTSKYAKLIVNTRKLLIEALEAANNAKEDATYGEKNKKEWINEIEKKRNDLEEEIKNDNNLRDAADYMKRRLTFSALIVGAVSFALVALEVVSNLAGLGINPLELISKVSKKNTQQVVQTENQNQKKIEGIKGQLSSLQYDLQKKYNELLAKHDALEKEYEDLKSQVVISCDKDKVDFKALSDGNGNIKIRSIKDIEKEIEKAEKAGADTTTLNNEKTNRGNLNRCIESKRNELKKQLCTSESGNVSPLKDGPLCDGPIYRIVEDKNKKRVEVLVYNEKEDCPKDCRGGGGEEPIEGPYE